LTELKDESKLMHGAIDFKKKGGAEAMKMKKLVVREAESVQTTAAALYCSLCC
jgi:hypothetical protein